MKKNFVKILSKREYEVLNLIIDGNKTKDISELLKLKTNTISTIKKNIHNKLKTNSDIDIVKFAIEEGILIINNKFY